MSYFGPTVDLAHLNRYRAQSGFNPPDQDGTDEMNNPYRYLVYREGDNYRVKNGSSGAIVQTSNRADIAIQTAKDEAASEGGNVLLGDGPFELQAGVNLRSHVNLVGVGKDNMLRMTAVTAENLLHGVDVEDIRLANFAVDGNRAIQSIATNDSEHNNVRFSNASAIEITRVESYGAVYHGIFITTDTPGTTAYGDVDVNRCRLHHNGFRSLHIHGIDAVGIENVWVVKNYSHHNGVAPTAGQNTGVFCAYINQDSTIITENIIEDEEYYGLTVEGASIGAAVEARNAIIGKNVIKRCEIGFTMTGAFEDAEVIGNFIMDNTTHGAEIRNDCKGVSVIANHVLRNGSRGIIMQATANEYEHMSFVANQVRDNLNRGMELRKMKGGVVLANHLNDNGPVDGTGANGMLLRDSCEDVVVSSNTIASRNKGNSGEPSLRVMESTGILLATNICTSRDSGTEITIDATCADTKLNGNVGTVSDSGTNTKTIDYL